MPSFLCEARSFVFYLCFRLGTSPPRGTAGCATFPFRVGFRLLSRLPATIVAYERVLMLVSVVFAPVFFDSPFFVFPLRHADGTLEGFDWWFALF